MKWGRRKTPDSPPPPPPPPSTASPSRLTSLLVRFKKMAAGKGRDTTRESVGNEQLGHASHGRSAGGGRRRAEVYYGDDAFWSLSFRKEAERPERVDATAGDDVEEPGQVKNFDQMVSGVRRMGEVLRKEGASMEPKTLPMPGKFSGKKLGSRSRVGTDNLPDSSRIRRKDIGCSETVYEETEHLALVAVPEEQRFTGLKFLDVKTERQRKSPLMSRGSPVRRPRPSRRVRINSRSPRSTSGSETRPICMVRIQSPQLGPGPEKRTKPKSKKKNKEKGIGLERFAVEKSTSDPHRDFRSSMIEMILERRIRRPKELEELLACYLTLNPDEYHEVIIEVFRQIWFEMNRVGASHYECDNPSGGLQTEEDW